jgi:hypothetical protein
METNEMGGVCNRYGNRRVVYRVLVGNLKDKDHLGEPGVDGRIIFR